MSGTDAWFGLASLAQPCRTELVLSTLPLASCAESIILHRIGITALPIYDDHGSDVWVLKEAYRDTSPIKYSARWPWQPE